MPSVESFPVILCDGHARSCLTSEGHRVSVSVSSAKLWFCIRHLCMHAMHVQVRDYLFSQADLNLTRSDEASVASNVLYMMELLPPPKAAALAYLDSGGQAPLPPRQAIPPSSTLCTLHALKEACSIFLHEEVILQGCNHLQEAQNSCGASGAAM